MIHVLFFLSGIAGLVYEVCWVRAFGNVFGNTVHSAALVSAVFMLGLGLGSRLAGGWADRNAGRHRAMVKGYAGAELGVAAIGAALAFGVPRLADVAVSLSSYARGAHGWYEPSLGTHVIRYAIAIALLAAPTLLMGATLTLLVRARVDKDVGTAGFRIAILYGINTAGAALGAVATDSLLVPRVGIRGTQLVAVLLNVVVALGAIALATRTEDAAEDAPAEGEGSATTPTVWAGAVALALSGFAALGMEIAWFRFLSMALGGYRIVFSLVLAAIVAGIWIGATIAGLLVRRFGRPLVLFVGSQGLLALVSLGLLVTYERTGTTEHGIVVRSTLALVLVPSILMGFSFPLVNADVQDAADKVARRAGTLYLANTLGSVVGSLLAGFVLAPRLGSSTSFAIFAFAAAVAPLALVLVAPRTRTLTIATIASGAVVVPAIAAFAALPRDLVLRRFMLALPPPDAVLDLREGENEVVAVVKLDDKDRLLATNGHPMSGTRLSGQRYMRAFAHVPLLLGERGQRALVICFGVGNTLHATSLHPIPRIEIADLSKNVLEHAPFFHGNNKDVLSDPRVSVFVEDGRQHLRAQPPGSYDLVTLEPPPIMFAGVASLYSREFYELVRSRLAPTGYTTQWLPAYDVPPDVGLAMVRAFVDVFPNAVLLSGYGPELVLMGSNKPEVTVDLDHLEARFREEPAVLEDLRRVKMGTLTEIVGAFVADAEDLRRATLGVTPITDDAPALEYTFGRPVEHARALFGHAASVSRFCPKCEHDPRVQDLPAYLATLDALYVTKRFRAYKLPFPEPKDASATIDKSDYLRALFARTDPRTLLALGSQLAHAGRLAEAARAYEQGLASLPDELDARYDLAVVLASLGREDDALAHVEKVLAKRPDHARAKAMLCSMRPARCPAP